MSRDIDGFETLDEGECMALLAQMRHPIGRVGVGIGVVPIDLPGQLRASGRGHLFLYRRRSQLRAALKNQVVGFEVDEFDAQYHQGVSVFVMGVAEVITDPETVAWAHALVMPWAPGRRTELVRIVPEFVSGRRIRHGFVSPDVGPEEVVK